MTSPHLTLLERVWVYASIFDVDSSSDNENNYSFLLPDKASTKLFGIIMDRIEKGNQVDYILYFEIDGTIETVNSVYISKTTDKDKQTQKKRKEITTTAMEVFKEWDKINRKDTPKNKRKSTRVYQKTKKTKTHKDVDQETHKDMEEGKDKDVGKGKETNKYMEEEKETDKDGEEGKETDKDVGKGKETDKDTENENDTEEETDKDMEEEEETDKDMKEEKETDKDVGKGKETDKDVGKGKETEISESEKDELSQLVDRVIKIRNKSKTDKQFAKKCIDSMETQKNILEDLLVTQKLKFDELQAYTKDKLDETTKTYNKLLKEYENTI